MVEGKHRSQWQTGLTLTPQTNDLTSVSLTSLIFALGILLPAL